MANILALSHTPKDYYNMALESIKRGDYSFAIENLISAIKLDDNMEYYIELAEVYERLGSYSQSNNVYYNLTDRFPCYEYLFCIARNLYKSGEVNKARSFTIDSSISIKRLKMNSSERLENIRGNEIIVKLFGTQDGELFNTVDGVKLLNMPAISAGRTLEKMKDAFEKCDFDKVVTEGLIADKKSPQYPFICGTIAKIMLMQGEFDSALQKIQEYVSLKPHDPVAIGLIFDYSLHDDNYTAVGEKLANEAILQCITNKNVAELSLILTTLNKCGRFELSDYCASVIRELQPENFDGLYYGAIFELARGSLEEGRKYVKKLNRWYPFDYDAVALKTFVYNNYQFDWLDAINDGVPEEIKKKLSENVLHDLSITFFKDENEYESFVREGLITSSLYADDLFDKILAVGYEKHVGIITKYAREMLYSEYVPLGNKLRIIRFFMCNEGFYKDCLINLDTRLSSITIKPTTLNKEESEWILDAFISAFCQILLMGKQPSYIVLEKIVAKMNSQKNVLLSEPSYLTATIMISYFKAMREGYLEEKIVEFFGLNSTILSDYLIEYKY